MNQSSAFPYRQAIVIGGTGQTGHRVIERLVEIGVSRIVATSRLVSWGVPTGPLAHTITADVSRWENRVRWSQLDFEAPSGSLAPMLTGLAPALDEKEPTVLVVAAALTNVEGCETEPARCERVNISNTIEAISWCRRRYQGPTVFYSSDYVFDGREGPYAETALRNPISAYGRAKADVERWLESEFPDALVLRTTGVYDRLPGSKNFLMQMLQLWSEGKTTRVPFDQFANPVTAAELARATVELIGNRARGCYHVGGGSQLARVDFARLIARVFGHDEALVQPVATSELGQKALRPMKGGLICDKLRRELGWAPEPAEIARERLRAVVV